MRLHTGFWMHDKFMDVCIEIIRITYKDENKVKFKGVYWNLGYEGNPWPLDLPQNMTLPINKIKEFTNITNRINIKRTKPGVP